jgi:hypothetical protein
MSIWVNLFSERYDYCSTYCRKTDSYEYWPLMNVYSLDYDLTHYSQSRNGGFILADVSWNVHWDPPIARCRGCGPFLHGVGAPSIDFLFLFCLAVV